MTGGSEQDASNDLRCLCEALCAIESPDEAAAFLTDLCSQSELASLSQRLAVALLLNEGMSYLDISHATGASSTTVSRVSKCLHGTSGGYRIVLSKLEKREVE